MNQPLTLNFGLGALPLITSARTRSISAENPTGEKGKGGMARAILAGGGGKASALGVVALFAQGEGTVATTDSPATSFRDRLVESLKKNNHTQGMVGGLGLTILIVLVSNLIGFDLGGFIAGLLRP